ncbi:NAD-dependent epimerase/dehydratase family protein [Salmonella enterica subsp. enterica]|nr:NAD-dependent epimerase/dehydratase family protein [Salmonella enterica subsp. enterica serovar Enteritidis]
MKIALIGATGFVGSAALAELLARGHTITAIARDTTKIAPAPNLTVKQVDVNDVDALADAARGNDVVISTFNGGWSNPDIYNAHVNGSRAIHAATKKAGVRLIAVGGAGSLYAPDGSQFVDGPDFPAEYKAGAKAARDALSEAKAAGGDDWTFVSPPFTIAPGERTGKYRTALDQPVFDANGESKISVQDFAVALADEAEKPTHKGQRFTVGY